MGWEVGSQGRVRRWLLPEPWAGGAREAVRYVWKVEPGDPLVWREVTGDGVGQGRPQGVRPAWKDSEG